jgi:hypothetical protein
VRRRKRGAQCRLSDEGSEQPQAAKACANPGITLLLNAGEQPIEGVCAPPATPLEADDGSALLFGNVSHSSAPRVAVEPTGILDEDVIGTHRGTVVRRGREQGSTRHLTSLPLRGLTDEELTHGLPHVVWDGFGEV